METAFATTKSLVTESKLDVDEAKKIDRQTAGIVFYSGIGDDKSAIRELSDIYVSITNVDPQKAPQEKQLSCSELNQLLLNLMTKSQSIMNRLVKEEIVFIFARGTGPVYAEELNDLVNLLTEARLLDGTLKKEDNLSRLVRTEWSQLRESLLGKETLAEFLEAKPKVERVIEETGTRDVIQVGAKVIIQEEGNEPEKYTIVGPAEANPRNGRISNESPLGRALMDHRAGDKVRVDAPGGSFVVQVLKVE